MVVPLLQGLLCSPPVLVRMIFLEESACWYGLVNLLLVSEIRTLEGMVLLQTLPPVLCVLCSCFGTYTPSAYQDRALLG